MADPVTNNYSLVLPTVGGDLNLWGGVLNNGVITALDTILSGVLPVSITSSDVTLTAPQFQNAVFSLSGALTGNHNLIIPLSPNSPTLACAGRFVVENLTTGAFNVTVVTQAVGSVGVVVPQGLRTTLYSDGTNIKLADDSKLYAVPVNGSPNGQLAGTAASVNNPPFPLAVDYVSKALWLPTTTGNATTTVWQKILTNSAPIPTALFTSLAIKVLTNTTISVLATGVSLTDGAGNYFIAAPNSTINMGTTGANALDTGAIATSSWYAIFVIAKVDGTTACLASLSATAPTLPSDYVYFARVGWVRTSGSVAQLRGTWQFGRRAQYIVGLAQTTTARVMTSGPSAAWTALSVSSFVPPTASIIFGSVITASSGIVFLLAPNSSYTASAASLTNGPPIVINTGNFDDGRQFELLLESTNIYYGCNVNSFAIYCSGWEDNL
jgi:hypothetical protein